MKTLITGGAGFIGSHLAEKLLKNGEEVFIIDDLSTGSMKNIEQLKENKNFHYIIDTILNEDILEKLIDNCDQIYHLAAAVGVKLIIDQPLKSLKTNINGTELVLELASKDNKRVLLASTSEVYGKNIKVPFTEDDDRLQGPTYISRWGYACSKAIDEFLALAYFRERKLPVIIARFFNTVGPRQSSRYGMVIPRFIRQAITHQPIVIHGDGKQSRCFACVYDVTDAIIGLMTHPHSIGEIFNIGSDEEITIENLAKKIKQMTKSNSTLDYISYEEAYENGFEDMRRRVPSITKISKLIGYKPTYSLDKTLQEIVDFSRKNLCEY